MAATIESVTETQVAANVNHNVAMPGATIAGELLIILFSASDEDPGTNTITTPGGWTELYKSEAPVDDYVVAAAYIKVADGTEGGNTVNVVTGDAQSGAAQVYRISDWWGALVGVESAETGAIQTQNPNPPSLNPGAWVVEDTLWLAVTHAGDDDATVTVYPANYTNGVDTVSGDGNNAGCEVGSARRENTVAAEDPGTFTLSEAERTVSVTIAIRPAAPTGRTIIHASSATSVFLNLQSGMARPYWEINYTVSGDASTTSGTLGQAYSTNDIISLGTIDREKPVAVSGLSRIIAGSVVIGLDNGCGTYSPLATGSIFTDAQGSAKDYLHSTLNIWAGFINASGTAYTIQRGSFLLQQLRIDGEKHQAYLHCQDVAKIPLDKYVGLPGLSGTAIPWKATVGADGTEDIMANLLSAVSLTANQYDLVTGYSFPTYAIEEKTVGNAIAELAQANDGYVYTNGKGQIVFRLNAPPWAGLGGGGSELTLRDSTRISKLRFNVDVKNLINKVTVKYTTGGAFSRASEDATVVKGREQIITNEIIDRPAIANAITSEILGQFKEYRTFIELDNVWLPSLEIGQVIDIYDTNTYQTAVPYEIYRIREDIVKGKSKFYGVTDLNRGVKWGFCSASDVANCGTNFTASWSSGFAFAASSTAFDAEGDNDGTVESGVGSGGGADKTGIELPFLTY